MGEVQKKVLGQSNRDVVSRLFNAKDGKETIAARKLDLSGLFNVRPRFRPSDSASGNCRDPPFQTELAINTHTVVTDIHRNVLIGRTRARSAVASVMGITVSHSGSIPLREPPPHCPGPVFRTR